MINNIFSIKGRGLKEVGQKVLSIGTISVGSWIIFDKIRYMLRQTELYDQYGVLVAIFLLYIGLVILDIE